MDMILLFLGAGLLYVGRVVCYSIVVAYFWHWFFASSFHMPYLPTTGIIALAVLLSCCQPKIETEKGEESNLLWVFKMTMMYPLNIFLLGWMLQLFNFHSP